MKNWPREYRYLIVIFIGFIIFLGTAVLVQIFKSTNWFAGWLFTFLNEWAMVLSATATLSLAGVAFWAIMDNRHGRRVDRRQRLQSEICSWAEDALKALFVPSLTKHIVEQANMREKLEAISAKSSIVKTNAGELNDHLADKVKNTATHLNHFIDNLKYAENIDEFEIVWENLKKDFLKIIESASLIDTGEFR